MSGILLRSQDKQYEFFNLEIRFKATDYIINGERIDREGLQTWDPALVYSKISNRPEVVLAKVQ